ncbi:hypothetical protein HAX54_051772 [Datura stramonium]|uniref:Uncharacterized protein n=1 Tax=Datura stramonium TaxID=4076 RepID=A0ABS8WQB8_DATST|nr:hypothetical protein [Datura stramonium]
MTRCRKSYFLYFNPGSDLRAFGVLQEEIDHRKELIPPIYIDLKIPPVGPNSPVAHRSSLDDWCIGRNPIDIVVVAVDQDGKSPHVEMVLTMDIAYQGDPYRVAPIDSYQKNRTVMNRWVMTLPDELLVLPPDHLLPSIVDIASWIFS